MQNVGDQSPRSQEANSIKDYINKLKVSFTQLVSHSMVQGQLGDAYGELKDYKKLSEQYRGEIEQMRHVLEAVN